MQVHPTTLLPPSLFSRDMAVTSLNDAVLVCPAVDAGASPWAACVVIGYRSMASRWPLECSALECLSISPCVSYWARSTHSTLSTAERAVPSALMQV